MRERFEMKDGRGKDTCGAETHEEGTSECRFYLPQLPYEIDALEPYIDAETIWVHHFVLHKKYVDNLNEILKCYPEYACCTLVELIENCDRLPEAIRTPVMRNAGGVLNHNYYFDMMHPPIEDNKPTGALLAAMEKQHGSFEGFRREFTEKAMEVFGSGWTWLVLDQCCCLDIINTENQVTPYSYCKKPIIPLDLWEHAYFLQYKADRRSYIEGWFMLADWEKAGMLYDLYMMEC